MTDHEVRVIVHGWLTDVMGVTVIHAYQSGPEPEKPYAVLTPTMNDALDPHPVDREYPDDTTEVPVRNWLWRFAVDLFGDDGGAILRRIKAAGDVRQRRAGLSPLVFADCAKVADLTEMIEASREMEVRHRTEIEVRGLTRDAATIVTAGSTEPVVVVPR